MDYFNVRPDFVVLNKYYPISIPKNIQEELNTDDKKHAYYVELTELSAKDGVTLGVESYIEKDITWFDRDNIEELTNQFYHLVGVYELLEHFDNLLYMIAAEIQAIDSYFNYLQYESYDFQQRLKEMSGFMYALRSNSKGKKYQLTLTSSDIKTKKQVDLVRITDQKLITWISNFSMKEVDESRSPIGYTADIDHLIPAECDQ